MDITQFLKLMVEKHGSDMFLSTGAPIHIKVEGRLYPLGTTNLPSGLVERIAYSMMDKDQIETFERDMEMNMALAIADAGRFRVNVFRQRGEVGMVIRTIRTEIPSIEELQLPPVLRDIITKPRGLVLVVGSTGSGKSTTLASMIDHRNSTMTGHILTIEDPIEFLHRHKRSLVNQREVGIDTQSFHHALKNAMRESPDVVLIGEILDAATMEAAISFSETGHLCLATLHSNNADQALERILNFFPEAAHKNVLMNLSLNLNAVISQRLVKGKDGKRLPAVEVLINTPFVRDLIRRGEIHKIKQAMEESLAEQMQTFDQALFNLYKQDRIEMAEALNASDSSDGLALKFRLSGGGHTEHDPYADVFTATPVPIVAPSIGEANPFQFNTLPDPSENRALMDTFNSPIPGITQGFDESNFNG
ncbi:type IV pili twitching motility protein PilT [Lysobacteraceae bacterium NML75-0749]|nr:type IV pili twitching motility protein PilT [Xanthomonadaceae bacterium NML75-0749]